MEEQAGEEGDDEGEGSSGSGDEVESEGELCWLQKIVGVGVFPVMTRDDETELFLVWTNRGICLRKH